MISLPTLDGVISALKALLESGAVIAAIMLIGEIIYRLEERKKMANAETIDDQRTM